MAQKHAVYELAKHSPEYGIGSDFTKTNWLRGTEEFGETFWTLTKIAPKANGRTGNGAWGVLTWKGKKKATEEKIGGTHKTVWKVLVRSGDSNSKFSGVENECDDKDANGAMLDLALPNENDDDDDDGAEIESTTK